MIRNPRQIYIFQKVGSDIVVLKAVFDIFTAFAQHNTIILFHNKYFLGNLVPIVFLAITYHLICKDNAFYLSNDMFVQK